MGKIWIGYWNMWPVYIQASVCGNDTVQWRVWELQWAVMEHASACKERGMEISESKTIHTTQGIKRRLNNAWKVKEQTKLRRLNTKAA